MPTAGSRTGKDVARYLARKEREIAVLDRCLATPLGLPPPRTISDVIENKRKLAAAIRAERSLASWAITETARPGVQEWEVGAYRLSFGYQRADLEVKGPSLYPALDPGLAQETTYAASGMGAIAALVTALMYVYGTLDVHAARGGYGETRELFERYPGRIRALPLTSRRNAAEKRGARIVWLDSAGARMPRSTDPMPRDTDLVVCDTTCFWQGSGHIRRVARWARRHDVSLALVRSHAKLDSLGVEYGRLGSIVLAWRRAGASARMRDVVRETRNAVRLLGVAPIPVHLPPFAGSDEYRRLSAARTAAIVRNTRRLARGLARTPLRDAVKVYRHGLYLTLAPRGELRVRDVKRAVDALCGALGDTIRHAGSFGFDFVAVEWFADPLTRRNVVRIAPGDLPVPTMDALARRIAAWFARQEPKAR